MRIHPVSRDRTDGRERIVLRLGVTRPRPPGPVRSNRRRRALRTNLAAPARLPHPAGDARFGRITDRRRRAPLLRFASPSAHPGCGASCVSDGCQPSDDPASAFSPPARALCEPVSAASARAGLRSRRRGSVPVVVADVRVGCFACGDFRPSGGVAVAEDFDVRHVFGNRCGRRSIDRRARGHPFHTIRRQLAPLPVRGGSFAAAVSRTRRSGPVSSRAPQPGRAARVLPSCRPAALMGLCALRRFAPDRRVDARVVIPRLNGRELADSPVDRARLTSFVGSFELCIARTSSFTRSPRQSTPPARSFVQTVRRVFDSRVVRAARGHS